MTHEQFLEKKEELIEILSKTMFDVLSKMSHEELKQIDWFNASNYNNIPTICDS